MPPASWATVFPAQKQKRKQKEKLIVVFCPTITSPYYVLLLQGIEAVANERGYGVFICNTQRDARLEEKYLRMIRAMAPPRESFMPAILTRTTSARWRRWQGIFRWSSSATRKKQPR